MGLLPLPRRGVLRPCPLTAMCPRPSPGRGLRGHMLSGLALCSGCWTGRAHWTLGSVCGPVPTSRQEPRPRLPGTGPHFSASLFAFRFRGVFFQSIASLRCFLQISRKLQNDKRLCLALINPCREVGCVGGVLAGRPSFLLLWSGSLPSWKETSAGQKTESMPGPSAAASALSSQAQGHVAWPWLPSPPPLHPKQRQAFCLLTHKVPQQPQSVQQSPMVPSPRHLPQLQQLIPPCPPCPGQTALYGHVPRVSVSTGGPVGQDNGPYAPWDPKSSFREGEREAEVIRISSTGI